MQHSTVTSAILGAAGLILCLDPSIPLQGPAVILVALAIFVRQRQFIRIGIGLSMTAAAISALIIRSHGPLNSGVWKGPFQFHVIVLWIGLSLVFTDVRIRSVWLSNLFALLAGMGTALALMGYVLWHFYPFYGESAKNAMSVSLMLVIGGAIWGLVYHGPSRGLARILKSAGPAGQAARRLLLMPILVPLLLGAIHTSTIRQPWYSPLVGGWLFSFGNTIGFAFVVWWNVQSLYAADRYRARIRAALFESNRQLERRVAERTRELQAQADALRSSNEQLEQFAYIASHDLQQPVRNIALYTQLLERRHGNQIGEEGRDLLQVIQSGSQRMSALVKDLLAYSKTVHQALEREPVHLSAAVKVALENCSVAIRESGTQVQVSELPVVEGNFTEFVRLFQNLISNSIRYRASESPRIEIECLQRDGGEVILVRDNGIGIAPEHHEKIFGLFKRLHAGDDGTGLGLALCRRIAERHGGRIWVESEPGKGACFCVTLPGTRPRDMQAQA